MSALLYNKKPFLNRLRVRGGNTSVGWASRPKTHLPGVLDLRRKPNLFRIGQAVTFPSAVDVAAASKRTAISNGGLVHRRTILSCISARRRGRPRQVGDTDWLPARKKDKGPKGRKGQKDKGPKGLVPWPFPAPRVLGPLCPFGPLCPLSLACGGEVDRRTKLQVAKVRRCDTPPQVAEATKSHRRVPKLINS